MGVVCAAYGQKLSLAKTRGEERPNWKFYLPPPVLGSIEVIEVPSRYFDEAGFIVPMQLTSSVPGCLENCRLLD